MMLKPIKGGFLEGNVFYNKQFIEKLKNDFKDCCIASGMSNKELKINEEGCFFDSQEVSILEVVTAMYF